MWKTAPGDWWQWFLLGVVAAVMMGACVLAIGLEVGRSIQRRRERNWWLRSHPQAKRLHQEGNDA